ncbi:hypothetical protein [Paraburkholderia lycopersici]|uniref:hypothetical protein n=1 Tax=Paraburkholderia lycopersici TaxID=416944 RepID=UPI000B81CD62|nr:hypothetical protein [Paraburkholderia lycopersici]
MALAKSGIMAFGLDPIAKARTPSMRHRRAARGIRHKARFPKERLQIDIGNRPNIGYVQDNVPIVRLNFAYHTQQAHHPGDERHIVFAPPFIRSAGISHGARSKIKLIPLHAARLGRANRRAQQHERARAHNLVRFDACKARAWNRITSHVLRVRSGSPFHDRTSTLKDIIRNTRAPDPGRRKRIGKVARPEGIDATFQQRHEVRFYATEPAPRISAVGMLPPFFAFSCVFPGGLQERGHLRIPLDDHLLASTLLEGVVAVAELAAHLQRARASRNDVDGYTPNPISQRFRVAGLT